MLQRLKICLLALALGLCCATALATDLVLERAIFEDASGQMTLAQAKDAQFTAAPATIFKGFSRSAFWIRLKVDVPAGAGPLFVSIRPNLLDKATLYYPAAQPPGGEVALQMDARAEQKETQVSLAPGLHTLYLRAETIGAMLLQAQVLSPAGAIEQALSRQFILGALISVYAMLAVAILGVVLLLRESFVYLVILPFLTKAQSRGLMIAV